MPKRRFFRPEDIQDLRYEEFLGDPGSFPYTRGIHTDMYRNRLWTMRQYAGFGTAEESNQRYRFLLDQGSTGLSVAFDLPTQIGLDSDHPMSRGEVGRVGVAIDSLEDMDVLFREIPLDQVSTSMTINATAAILLALYLVVAKRRGIAWNQLRGTVQNDILKEYYARGTYIYPPEPSLRLVTDILAFCREQVPQWNTISVSGYHIREAGSTAVQEVAFTLANAETYVREALKTGMKVDEFAPRISFFFNCHNDFFEEIAKFRAARFVWAKRLRERFQAEDPRSLRLRFHAQTAGSTLTAQQPENNTVRVAYQALAAVLGGAQSLHTNARDEALSLPTEASAQLALRTQQILAYESGVPETPDPLGGSWLVEAMTRRIVGEVEEYLERIEKLGGVLAALEKGFFQREIQEAAYRHQKNLEDEVQIVVGVNRFSDETAVPVPTLKLHPEVESSQISRVQELRRRRHPRVKSVLERLSRAADSTDNLMPHVIGAVEALATVGEISQALRSTWGEYREAVVI